MVVAMTEAGHRILDHTADIAIEIWAPTESALLVQGAHAVVALLTDGATPTATTERTVELTAVDPEDRLVRWLAEVLYLGQSEGYLFAGAQLSLGERDLRATVTGQADATSLLRNEIKAVTYHDVALLRSPTEIRARIVLDV